MANSCPLHTTIYSLQNDAAGKELLKAVPQTIAAKAAATANLPNPSQHPFEDTLYRLSFDALKSWLLSVVNMAAPDAFERSASFPVGYWISDGFSITFVQQAIDNDEGSRENSVLHRHANDADFKSVSDFLVFQALFQGLNTSCFTETFLGKVLLGTVGRPAASPSKALPKKAAEAWRVAMLIIREENRKAAFGKKLQQSVQRKEKLVTLTKHQAAKREDIQAKLNQAAGYANSTIQLHSLVDPATRALIQIGSAETIFAIHQDLKNEFALDFPTVDLGGVYVLKNSKSGSSWTIDISLPEVIIGWRLLRELKNMYLYVRLRVPAAAEGQPPRLQWTKRTVSLLSDAGFFNHAAGTVLSHLLMVLEVPLWITRQHLEAWLSAHEHVTQKIYSTLKLLAVRGDSASNSFGVRGLGWLESKKAFRTHLLDNHTKHLNDCKNMDSRPYGMLFQKPDGSYGAGILFVTSETSQPAAINDARVRPGKWYESGLIMEETAVGLQRMISNDQSRRAGQFLSDFFRRSVPAVAAGSVVAVYNVDFDPILNDFTVPDVSGPRVEEIPPVLRSLPSGPQPERLPASSSPLLLMGPESGSSAALHVDEASAQSQLTTVAKQNVSRVAAAPATPPTGVQRPSSSSSAYSSSSGASLGTALQEHLQPSSVVPATEQQRSLSDEEPKRSSRRGRGKRKRDEDDFIATDDALDEYEERAAKRRG